MSKYRIYSKVLAILAIVFLSLYTRLWKIDEIPIAPYWEEVALGYDAYSLLKTGKDHHGNHWPLLGMESFGDWKPVGYYYAAIPSIALFDLSVLSIRLPSAIAGIVLILAVASIARALKENWLIAAAVACISPWAIQFSRAAWEANLATALMASGVALLLNFSKTERRTVPQRFLGVVLIIVSMYTYHSARVIAPMLLIIVALYLFFRSKASKDPFNFIKYQNTLLLTVGCMIGVLPFIFQLSSPVVSQRFAETSIFYNISIIKESNELIESANSAIWARLVYHRYILFGKQILSNLLSHLDPRYLFFVGDANQRHSTGIFGILYHIDFIAVLSFLIILSKKIKKKYIFLIAWFMVSLVPASISQGVPHALRTLPALPPLLLIVSIGISATIDSVSKFGKKYEAKEIFRFFALTFIATMYIIEFGVFWSHYIHHYARTSSKEWQYGYAEVINKIEDLKVKYPESSIFITRYYGRPAMYYWFYSKTDPNLVQLQNNHALKDQGEFLSFSNIYFFPSYGAVRSREGIFAIAAPELSSIERNQLMQLPNTTTVNDVSGEAIWYILKQ